MDGVACGAVGGGVSAGGAAAVVAGGRDKSAQPALIESAQRAILRRCALSRRGDGLPNGVGCRDIRGTRHYAVAIDAGERGAVK